MTNPDRDSQVVEILTDVVRVNTLDDETCESGPLLTELRPENANTVNAAEARNEALAEIALPVVDSFDTNRREVVDR